MKKNYILLVLFLCFTFSLSAMPTCGEFKLRGMIQRNPESTQFELVVFPATMQETKYILPGKKYFKWLPYRDHWVEVVANIDSEGSYFRGAITEVISLKNILNFQTSSKDSQVLVKRDCK